MAVTFNKFMALFTLVILVLVIPGCSRDKQDPPPEKPEVAVTKKEEVTVTKKTQVQKNACSSITR